MARKELSNLSLQEQQNLIENRERAKRNYHERGGKERQKKYEAERKEWYAEWRRQWEKDNSERRRKQRREAYARNKEKQAARKRKWRVNNPDKARAIKRRWDAKNRDYLRAAGWKSYYRRYKVDDSTLTKEVITQVRTEEPNCRYCGCAGEQIDHIIPIVDGGTHARSNLQRLCKPCHGWKTGMENHFRNSLFQIINYWYSDTSKQ